MYTVDIFLQRENYKGINDQLDVPTKNVKIAKTKTKFSGIKFYLLITITRTGSKP